MLNHFKYRLKLKKLNDIKRKTQDSFSKEISAAIKDKKPRDEINSLKDNDYFEYRMIQEEIDILVTNYLRGVAGRLVVPLPDSDDEKMWEKCEILSNQPVLTTAGINAVRNTIRNERKGQWDLAFKIATLAIGLLGAATGLIAVIKN